MFIHASKVVMKKVDNEDPFIELTILRHPKAFVLPFRGVYKRQGVIKIDQK